MSNSSPTRRQRTHRGGHEASAPPGATPTPGPAAETVRHVHVLGHPDLALDLAAAPHDAQLFNCYNLCLLLSRAGVPFTYYGLRGSRLPPGGEVVDLGLATGPWTPGGAWHRQYTRRLDRALAASLRRTAAPQILASLYGCAHADLETPDELDLPVVEAMVGYDHCWAPYRVFPSYAHQSVIYSNPAEQVQRYVWFDTVIPHFVDADEYWIAPRRGDYALFLGRDVPAKGKALAEFACQQAGLPLRVVHRGLAGPAKTELLAHAVAVLMPTVYLEPFGYVAVEAQMCGVPAITTDWGAFAETVEQGKTGFRCRTAAEFRLAIEQVRQLDPVYIRARAKALYSIEAAMPAYLAYFDFVWRTHRYGGFYAEHAVRWPIRQACTPASITC